MISRYDVYTTVQSIYCYRDSNVLRNRLNITDPVMLKRAEEEITAVKQMELYLRPIRGNLTKTHLLRIHRFLFEDLYPFAGRIRREQISKADTMFHPPAAINTALNHLFAAIRSERMLGKTDRHQVIENLSYVMSELNIIHPFREGNGRTIREFIRLMAARCGYTLNWGNAGRDKLLAASMASVDNPSAMIPILQDCIE